GQTAHRRSGAGTTRAPRLDLLFLVGRGQLGGLRGAAARFFLGAAAGFGLGLQTCLLLGLTAGGLLTLALAALF
ncbi:hypothetical protein, partial [Mesorhizobium sp.]|uniref:hypothetical protein n=1 Tax=Mesorhizobium sp. TaxID=1871066 RepID=UPI00257B13E3